MTAFGLAIDAMFADANIGTDATWYQAGAGAGVPVRIITRAPDVISEFGDSRLVSDSLTIDVRLSEIAVLADGDEFDIGGSRYAVRGEPRRDREQLVWTAELVAA